MHKAVVLGNGESRRWFTAKKYQVDAITWGCNAIYRDMHVHNLVAVDYGMQQEIYDSGYCLDNPEFGDIKVIHFANWSIVPAEIADMMFMGYDIPESFVHRSKNKTAQCVISGKDPNTLQEKIKVATEMNPHLDMNDLKLKMEKDVGVWITYVEENDDVINTALHLACQKGHTEVYILGFDLSTYEEPLNNIYKGTDNYLSSDAKGFNSMNWQNQMQTVFREFKDVNFYWIDAKKEICYGIQENNVSYLTKAEFCDTVVTL